jgi:hypothetical protein
MNSNIVSIAQLEKAGRWRVEIFIKDADRDTLESNCPMVAIGSLCEELSEATEPPQSGENTFTYVGLENVEPITGDRVGEIQKPTGSVKSRSKMFQKGDVLYGRLRPALRKVFNATAVDGLCTPEFIVLRPNEKVSAPILRSILASRWVSSQLEKLQIGAALPRVSARDLLALKVPLPSREKQRKLERTLERLAAERATAKTILESAAKNFEEAVDAAII